MSTGGSRGPLIGPSICPSEASHRPGRLRVAMASPPSGLSESTACLLLLLLVLALVPGSTARLDYSLNVRNTGPQPAVVGKLPRPGRFDHAGTARWLIASNTWGVASTISIHLQGSPFGNVVSFSDGLPGNFTGTPYFYVSPMDFTAQDVSADVRCSLTVSEHSLGTCRLLDPEDPLCSKLALSGKMEVVTEPDELSFARESLFHRHPEMRGWPKDHDFTVYVLRIADVFLVDVFGGPRPLSVDQYYTAPVPSRQQRAEAVTSATAVTAAQ